MRMIKRALLCVVGVAALGNFATRATADLIPIGPGDFLPGATIIDFETGSTGLPSVPGVTFVNEGSPGGPGWFAGSANFDGFFGGQGWSNLVSLTYSDLALVFDTPVDAVGAYVGRIPNFLNEHPSTVVVELFDASSSSLGSATISIPPAFDSPVWFGYRADAPIARLEIRVNDSGFIGVDNVTFGSAVPEPGSIALVGSGLAFLGLVALRRRPGARGMLPLLRSGHSA
jgi:hypothetical protein